VKRKIIIAVLSLLLMIGLVGTFWGTSIAEAASGLWNSCPRGEVNDAYPGDCHDYIDTNNDGICDRSQSNPQLSSTAEDSSSSLTVDSSTVAANNGDSASTAEAATDGAGINSYSYNFILICLVCIVLYCITWILSAKKIMKQTVHRKIWNVVLLISLIGSALLGLIRILIIDFNINISLPFNTLFWHVEVSIVLGIVALFHIFWHWRYFTTMLRTAKNHDALE
jgi:hypothetical protein